MARPRKYNADYFSHDNDMRNHRKVKAIRNKFGLEGYAIFNMLLETLAESDNFVLEIKTDINWELLSADFEIETDKLKKIMEYLIKIDLISKENNSYKSKNLIERLHPLLEKREYLQDKYTKTPISTTETKVSTAEMPQSKVKESKVKNEKKDTPPKISFLLLEAFKEIMKITTPDGDYQMDNLFPAIRLAKKIKVKYEEKEKGEITDDKILKGFKWILNGMDEFHKKNATSIKYINNNFIKIVNSIK